MTTLSLATRTATGEQVLLVSANNGVPTPALQSHIQSSLQAAGIDLEVVFVGGRGRTLAGSATGNHAEQRAIQFAQQEGYTIETQFSSHHACRSCNIEQNNAGVANPTGRADVNGGVTRVESGSRGRR